MTKKIDRRACVLWFMVMAVSLSASASTIEKQVHNALRYAQIEQVYDELAQSLEIALSEIQGQLSREQHVLMRKGISQGFDLDDINRDVEAHLIQAYNEANYNRLMAIWDSGFGEMVYDDRKQLEDRWLIIDLLTLQRSPQSRLLDYAEELKKNPPTQQRIDLVRELLVSTPDLELTMASRRELARAILLSAAQIGSESVGSLQSIDRHLEEMHAQWLEESASVIVLSYFYIYRHHSDRELQQVVYFYQQPTMQWFNQQLIKAYTLALEKAGRRSAGYIKSRNRT